MQATPPDVVAKVQRALSVALLLAMSAACRPDVAQVRLRAAQDTAQALDDAFSDWFVAQAEQAAPARIEELRAIDARWAQLLEAYQAAALAARLAIDQGRPQDDREAKSLDDLLAFLRLIGARAP